MHEYIVGFFLGLSNQIEPHYFWIALFILFCIFMMNF